MKQGMTKVSVHYPSGEGKTFDLDYYCNTHLPFVGKLLGDAVKAKSVSKGVGSAAPGSTAPYELTSDLFFDSIEDFQNSFGPNAEKIMADIPNFTNIEPVIQIGEVLG